MPTYAQLIIIVTLIVPGFAAIRVSQKLMPYKEKSAFDSSVSSVILTLFIHGVYTTLFIYLFNDKVNTIISDIQNNKFISDTSALWIVIYFIVLIIFIMLIGWFLAFIKNEGKLYKKLRKWGYQTSDFDNLWYELLYIYEISNETPYVIVEFEDIIYAGAVDRSSFGFGDDEHKELTLIDPRFKKAEEEKFQKANVKVLYLNLKDVKTIKFFNGDILIDSN